MFWSFPQLLHSAEWANKFVNKLWDTDYNICYEGIDHSVVGIWNSDGVVRGATSLRRWNCSWSLRNEQKEEHFRFEGTVYSEVAKKTEVFEEQNTSTSSEEWA